MARTGWMLALALGVFACGGDYIEIDSEVRGKADTANRGKSTLQVGLAVQKERAVFLDDYYPADEVAQREKAMLKHLDNLRATGLGQVELLAFEEGEKKRGLVLVVDLGDECPVKVHPIRATGPLAAPGKARRVIGFWLDLLSGLDNGWRNSSSGMLIDELTLDESQDLLEVLTEDQNVYTDIFTMLLTQIGQAEGRTDLLLNLPVSDEDVKAAHRKIDEGYTDKIKPVRKWVGDWRYDANFPARNLVVQHLWRYTEEAIGDHEPDKDKMPELEWLTEACRRLAAM